eukprot:216038_1
MATIDKFVTCNKDCEIRFWGRTVRNWHKWTNYRTCYGNTTIHSDQDIIATWKFKIEAVGSNSASYAGLTCIGIDSIIQPDTWFYGNKQSPNYGYSYNGEMYEEGQVKQQKQKYGKHAALEMELNTNLATLTFYKYDDANTTHKTLQYSFKIKTGPELKYTLAVCIKDAEVSIADFTLKRQNDVIDDAKQDTDDFEFDQLQNNYFDTLQKMKKYEEANLRQQTTISSLREQIEAFERKQEEKEEYDMNKYINEKMRKFQQIYNKTTLTNVRTKNPMNLMNNNSSLHKSIKSCEYDVKNTIKSLNTFHSYMENMKIMINDLSTPPKESEYKSWNIDMIIIWIAKLDNGRFVKYLSVLRSGFLKSEIIKGEYLPDLDVAALSVEPFNINSFPDKKD